jgi:hypothetical protein
MFELSTLPTGWIGPLLSDVLAAQRADEKAVSHPQIAAISDGLWALTHRLDDPIVWPVGAAAERIAGAAILQSRGAIRVRGWADQVLGEHVLLLTVAAVSTVSLEIAAEQARSLGAARVDACGVAVHGIADGESGRGLGTFWALSRAAHPQAITA